MSGDRDPFEALNARIALDVVPLLKAISRRLGGLTVLAWCQLLGMALVIGLLTLVLVRVI
jgi:hypothetical protein